MHRLLGLLVTPPAEPRHAIAMHGEPALPEGFTAFPYVNPDAPKGGRLVRGVLGTFDSLNPFIVKGLAPPEMRGAVYESLLVRGYDEPFTLYGLLARTVDTDDERTYVTFDLDPRATFADGKPVTAADVIFSWELLRDHGRPNYRIYYTKVARATALGERSVRFDIAADGDRELPLILGLMPILPRHAIDAAHFEETSLAPPLASGPYKVVAVDAGRSMTLRRNPTYWGRDLAVNRGFWNFDELRFDFFRDANSHLEAFKKGLYDLRDETDPGRWETAYDFPAVRDGRVIKEAFPSGLPKPMLAFVFNTRRPVFADVRVREAITLLFDFEWLNKNFFYGLYRRTASFFEGSELSARGLPADATERALLAPFPGAVRPDVLDGTYQPPVTDGSGRDRERSRARSRYLHDAGYELSGAVLQKPLRRAPPHLRDHGDDQGPGAPLARLRAEPQARRDRCPHPHGRRRAVRPAPHQLRLRHDPKSLGRVALPRKRAGVLLGLGCRRRAGQPQLHGHAQPRRRRNDRGAAARPRAQRVRLRRARARPRADVGHLRDPAVPSARPVDGAMGSGEASADDIAVGLSAGDLVARAGK